MEQKKIDEILTEKVVLELTHMLLARRHILLTEFDQIYQKYNFPALIEEIKKIKFMIYNNPNYNYQQNHNLSVVNQYLAHKTQHQFEFIPDSGFKLVQNIFWQLIGMTETKKIQRKLRIIFKTDSLPEYNSKLYLDLIELIFQKYPQLAERAKSLKDDENNSKESAKYIYDLYKKSFILFFLDDDILSHSKNEGNVNYENFHNIQLYFILLHFNDDGSVNDSIKRFLHNKGICSPKFLIYMLRRVRRALFMNTYSKLKYDKRKLQLSENQIADLITLLKKMIDQNNQQIQEFNLSLESIKFSTITKYKTNIKSTLPNISRLESDKRCLAQIMKSDFIPNLNGNVDYIQTIISMYLHKIQLPQENSQELSQENTESNQFQTILTYEKSKRWRFNSQLSSDDNKSKTLYIAILGNDDESATEILSYFISNNESSEMIQIPTKTECVYYDCGNIGELFTRKRNNLPSFLIEKKDFDLRIIRVFSQDNKLSLTDRMIIEKFIIDNTYNHIVTCKSIEQYPTLLPSLYHRMLFNHFDQSMYFMEYENSPPKEAETNQRSHIIYYQKGKFTIDLNKLFKYGINNQIFDIGNFNEQKITNYDFSFQQFLKDSEIKSLFNHIFTNQLKEKQSEKFEFLYSLFIEQANFYLHINEIPEEYKTDPYMNYVFTKVSEFYAIKKLQQMKIELGLEQLKINDSPLKKVTSYAEFKLKPISGANQTITKTSSFPHFYQTKEKIFPKGPLRSFIENKITDSIASDKIHKYIKHYYSQILQYINSKRTISILERRSIVINFRETIKKTIITELMHNDKISRSLIQFFPFNIFDERINFCIDHIKDTFDSILRQPSREPIDGLPKDSQLKPLTHNVLRQKERLKAITITVEAGVLNKDTKILDDA